MLKVYNGYKKCIDLMNRVLETIGVVLMLIMVIAVTYQVVMRYVFNNTPPWTEEVSLILMAWFVYFGVVIGFKENLHIGVTFIVEKFPKKMIFAIEILNNFLILGLSALFLHFGFSLAWFVRANRLPATGASASLFYYIIALAGVLMILVVLGKFAEQVIKRKELLND